MKTIEQIVLEKYDSQKELPAQKQISTENFMAWAKFGAQEAQRWIDVNEELPEKETGWFITPFLAKTKNEIRVVGFTGGFWHLSGGLCLKSGVVTHWRMIDRE